MERTKLSKNTEFIVKYDDGSEKRVHEGLLFEFEGNLINLHLGTDRKEALFAVAEAYTEMIDSVGLRDELIRYLMQREGEQQITS